LEKALSLSDDSSAADVWFNIGNLAVGIGDLNLAYQACKIAISIDAYHAESFNNLGILELRKGNIEQARSNFQTAGKLAPHMFEPFFNGALVSFKLGDCQESFELAQKALEAFPEHTDSKELIKQLKKHFTML
jgi:tetratricopeptide repeat protein 8